MPEIYFDELAEEQQFNLAEAAKEALAPGVVSIVGAALGGLIGSILPEAGFAIGLPGAIASQMSPNPYVRAGGTGFSAGLLAAGISNSIASKAGARQTDLAPMDKAKEFMGGFKNQWPFNMMGKKPDTEQLPESTDTVGMTLGASDPYELAMAEIEAMAADYRVQNG